MVTQVVVECYALWHMNAWGTVNRQQHFLSFHSRVGGGVRGNEGRGIGASVPGKASSSGNPQPEARGAGATENTLLPQATPPAPYATASQAQARRAPA